MHIPIDADLLRENYRLTRHAHFGTLFSAEPTEYMTRYALAQRHGYSDSFANIYANQPVRTP